MTLPTGTGWPDLDQYKDWARIYDPTDDEAIAAALNAVLEATVARCPVLLAIPCPSDVLYACLLWTNRLLSRRNSPDGIVGVNELGIATISRNDKDIIQLLSPYTAMVLG